MRTKRVMMVFMAVLAMTVSAVGVAFASPRGQEAPAADAATDVAPRPNAGLVLVPLTDGVKRVLDLPEELEGAAVAGTLPGSPAAEAGIVRGDVVVAVDGERVDSPRAVMAAIAAHQVGETAVLTLYRAGATVDVPLVLGEKPEREKPEWLRNLHHLLRAYPNIGEASVTIVGEDGEQSLYHAVVGTVVAVEGDVLTITSKAGNTLTYTVDEGVAVVKGGYKVALGRLQAGDPVAVLEVDGVLKAVVAGKLAEPAPRPHVRPSDAPVNPRKEIVERSRGEMKDITKGLRGGEQSEERTERIREQIRKLQERLQEASEHDGAGASFDDAPASASGQAA